MSRHDFRPFFLGFFVIGVVCGAVVAYYAFSDRSFSPPSSSLLTNQQFIEALRFTDLSLDDPDAVFAHVFSRLPDTVVVYPSENYYYFRFFVHHQEFSGNIRLDADDRDRGIVSFAYFAVDHGFTSDDALQSLRFSSQLTADDGVVLTPVDASTYRISYQNKVVTFHLHSLPQTLPPDMTLLPSERFVARTFDESGFQFVLVYDTTRPQFRFILDNSAPLPDVLHEVAPDIVVGQMSGFAFVVDSDLHRRVLIGVSDAEATRNTYFDGPFDQLADNAIDDTTFQEELEVVYPYARGQIDRRGFFLDSQGQRTFNRLAVTPYTRYASLDSLLTFVASCRQRSVSDILPCLTHDFKQDI